MSDEEKANRERRATLWIQGAPLIIHLDASVPLVIENEVIKITVLRVQGTIEQEAGA